MIEATSQIPTITAGTVHAHQASESCPATSRDEAEHAGRRR